MTELQRDLYQYFVSIGTRWTDNDVYGHVNNATYYNYFDTTANDYLIRVGGLDIHRGEVIGFVVASSCQYKKPIAFPDQLEVGIRVIRLGQRSVEYGLAIFKAGEQTGVAFGTFTHVFVSRQTGQAVPIPGELRVALSRLHTPTP